MKYDAVLDSPSTCRDTIRQLGFDPDQLTLEEQWELLELHARLGGETEIQPEELRLERRVLVAR